MTKHYTKSDLEAAYKFGQCGHPWETFARWFGREHSVFSSKTYGPDFSTVKCDKEIACTWAPISGENWEIASVESPDDPTETKSYDCHGMYNDE